MRNDSRSDVTWPYWTHDALLNAFVAKLRRMIVVTGKRKKPMVRYEAAWAYEEPRSTRFMDAVEKGIVAIDFDARTNNGRGLRNHGTKFRVAYEDLPLIYTKHRKLA